MVALSEVQLLYQQIATFLEDEHGVDPTQMAAPEELSPGDVDALRWTVSALSKDGPSIPIDMELGVSQGQYEVIAASERLDAQGGSDDTDHITATGVLDVRVRTLVTVGTVREIKILETKQLDDLIYVHVRGVLKDQTVTVHPAGSFREEIPDENTTN
ncbi:hypothetical protein [Deinococcus humi]|uniref:Uncharacterized protein n=1 Tax=Deinococcus humi TaxID=662880 RepID=A0A7W8JZ21_9DEIO|nr:hypothetical protein [Deinococcus humi]MBB5365840.1 hypothetical protein [Deinococcus humi]GGO39416.1 hypothetical protein GCM10008949_47530 [Deinococcus humi]